MVAKLKNRWYWILGSGLAGAAGWWLLTAILNAAMLHFGPRSPRWDVFFHDAPLYWFPAPSGFLLGAIAGCEFAAVPKEENCTGSGSQMLDTCIFMIVWMIFETIFHGIWGDAFNGKTFYLRDVAPMLPTSVVYLGFLMVIRHHRRRKPPLPPALKW